MKTTFAQHGRKRVLFIAEDETLAKVKSQKPDKVSLAYYNLDGSFGVLEHGRDRKFHVDDEQPLTAKILDVIARSSPDEVLLYHPLPYHDLVDIIMERPEVDIRVAPEVYAQYHREVRQKANGCLLPGVKLDEPNLGPYQAKTKRLLDISLSFLFLVLCSPLFLIVPLLIKLSDRGPILHTQTRCGYNGKTFRLYKFRSMVPDAEKLLSQLVDFERMVDPVFKIENDPRVTRIGRLLRKTSVDELPQLFNVLKGDLSLVGPRPEELALVRRYNSTLRERLKARPGVTGLQQIKCRGSVSMTERMQYDLAYIEKQSLWLDLKILFQTVRVVLSRKGAR
jgi:exopolysaccharide biosynthesis polyprenyl glycosylphosphotransferase